MKDTYGLLYVVTEGRLVAKRQVILSTMFTIFKDSMTLLNNYMIAAFQRKRVRLKNYDNLHMLVQKFTTHNMNALHKWRIMESKGDYTHVISGPTKCKQGIVYVLYKICREKNYHRPLNFYNMENKNEKTKEMTTSQKCPTHGTSVPYGRWWVWVT